MTEGRPELFTGGLDGSGTAELEAFVDGLASRSTVRSADTVDFEAIETALRDFGIARSFRMLTILNHFEIPDSGRSIDLFSTGVNLDFKPPGEDADRTEAQITDHRILCYLPLVKSLGHTVILPRKTSDFVTELFRPDTPVFPARPRFHELYRVDTDSPGVLASAFGTAIVDAFESAGDIHCEIIDDVLLAYSDGPLRSGTALKLVDCLLLMIRAGL